MKVVCVELNAFLTLALDGKLWSPTRSDHFIRGRALLYILWGHMSPTIDAFALHENVFILLGRTFFVQLFIFSKSINLHLIFMYSIGTIFRKRKSVQQLYLNTSTYGSLCSKKKLHRFYTAKIFCISWTQIITIAITPGRMMIHFNKVLRIYFNIIL
jgi:hypothetical protein